MNVQNAKLWHKSERHQFQDSLRYKRTCQGHFEAAMLHLDHPLPGGGRVLEATDGGRGAAAIRERLDARPLWMKLWRNARARLPPKGRRILDALAVDWRSRPAARIAHVDHKTVDSWKNLQSAFRPVFSGLGTRF